MGLNGNAKIQKDYVPTAIASTNGVNGNGNGLGNGHGHVTKKHAVPGEVQHLSSADVIQLEHEYGAHK